MCINRQDFEAEQDLDEDLLDLFKRFKDLNEQEAGEPLNNEDLRVDFAFMIQEKISTLDLN